MKIAFGIIVCNGADFLEPCIRQVYDFADQIVIAEGATESMQRAMGWNDPHSHDGTIQIIQKLMGEDKDKKISRVVKSQAWVNKIHQSNGYMELLDSDVDYIWQLDSDELYLKSDLEKTREWLEKTQPTYVTVKQHHFWKGFGTVAVGQAGGWGWETAQPRIQKFFPGCKYIEHRPPMIIDPISGNRTDQMKPPVCLTDETGVWCYHYNYVTEKQVQEKMAYYAKEFPGIDRLKSWFKDVWQAWDSDIERIEATYGTHPTAWKGSHTEPFTGRHPEEIEKLINGSGTVQDS